MANTIAVRSLSQIATASNNILTDFANFNEQFTWNKVSGGANANILNVTNQSYYGDGSCKMTFLGTGEVKFNAGSSVMETVIRKTGTYKLSYYFDKPNSSADVTFKVEVVVNGNAFDFNTIEQNLYSSSGFQNGKWNCYVQNIQLEDGDIVDFNFYAQCDTIGASLYFDGFKLECDDRNLNNAPSIYTEAPALNYIEENIITIGSILAGQSVVITGSLVSALVDRHFVSIKYPTELITLGLIVSTPTITANDTVKFIIYNPTASTITPNPDTTYYLKLIR